MTETSEERATARQRPVLLHGRPAVRSEDRRRVMQALNLTPDGPWRLRFAVMLGLSMVIAVAGLLANSPAVVIGAMLIAPLMTPVLAFAVSLSMGWFRHMARAGATVTLATLGAIGLGWVLATAMGSSGAPLTNEIVSRTSPRLLDLFVALAAGAAGAYATVRDDVSAALPGVAVAVALVPPLATVAVTLHAGQLDLAKGAMLLYAVNLVAIVLAGAVVLLVSGFVPLPRLSQVRRRVALSTTSVAAATVALAVVLSSGLKNAVDSATTIAAVNKEVASWLGPTTDLKATGVSLDGSVVTVELTGSNPPPPTSALAGALVSSVGPNASVQVRWSQRTRETTPKGAAPTTVAPSGTGAEQFRGVVEAWLHTAPLGEANFEILSMKLAGDELSVEVGGPTAPPQARSLAAALAAARGRPTKVAVRWTPRQEFAASSDAAAPSADVALRARQAIDSWARSHPDVAVLRVTVANGVTTLDVAASGTVPDLAALSAAVRAQAGTSTVVRLATLQLVTPTVP